MGGKGRFDEAPVDGPPSPDVAIVGSVSGRHALAMPRLLRPEEVHQSHVLSEPATMKRN